MLRSSSVISLCKGFSVIVLAMSLSACQGLSFGEEKEEDGEVGLQEALQQQLEPAGPDTLSLAQKALAEERYEDTEKLIERLLVSNADDKEAQLLLAELTLARGDPAAALAIFSDLVEDPLVGSRARQGYGITSLLIGDKIVAVRELDAALAADPSLWRAWNARGALHDGEQNWSEAEGSYRKALAIRPNSPMLLNNLGFSLFMQNRLGEAVTSLGGALRIDPQFELARTNLRLTLARQGDYLRALSGTSEEDLGQALNNVGYVALLRGDYEKAETYFLRAMEVEPTFNERAWRNLNYLKSLKEIESDNKS